MTLASQQAEQDQSWTRQLFKPKIETRGYVGIGLHCPKNIINIGEALRACSCYGAQFMAISGGRVYKRAVTDTQKSYRHMPLFEVENLLDMIPYDCVPVAVDLLPDARPLTTYVHPERAFYIFGPEDGTLGAKVTSKCRDVVYVPTNFCMNLAATVNVVLYDRLAKQQRFDRVRKEHDEHSDDAYRLGA